MAIFKTQESNSIYIIYKSPDGKAGHHMMDRHRVELKNPTHFKMLFQASE
jgi:hypothetical protein